MRWRSAAGLVLASFLLLATGGPVSLAQNEDGSRFFMLGRQPYGYGSGGDPYRQRQRSTTRQERSARPDASAGYGQQRYYYYDPRTGTRQPYGYQARPAQPGYQQPAFPWFSQPREAARPYLPPREARPYAEPRERPARRARRYAPAAPKPADKPEVAEVEVEPSQHVVVFGDSLAELVGQGLDEAFEEVEDIGIVRKARGDSGLIRSDAYDWPKAIQEYLSGDPKVRYAVVMLGANDRQAIREGETSHDPLSDRWKEIYRQRVDDVIKVFTERKLPFVWVGVPPMKNERASADMLALNDIYRERVQKAGGAYVDIWPGFVDDQNRYAATGPDVDGQVARLRTADGVHLTRAGARKAAHFADVELKRMIEARGGTAIATPSTDGTTAAKELDVERVINASLPALPEPQGLPSLPKKPLAGPVLPLTRPETSPGGALVSGKPRLDGDAYLADRAFREGLPPPPKPGRADDFKWPRS
jgi:hypothetical protein